MANTASIIVLLLTITAAYAQTNSIQGTEEGYFTGILNTLSTMDWQGMLRTVVDAAMQYFNAPTNRIDETSRAMHSFESDLIVNFVEQIKDAIWGLFSDSSGTARFITLPFKDGGIELTPELRSVLATNTFLADNVVLGSWQYAFWMISYCVVATLFGVLSIILLPDPATLAKLRESDQDTAAQNLAYGHQSYEKPSEEMDYESPEKESSENGYYQQWMNYYENMRDQEEDNKHHKPTYQAMSEENKGYHHHSEEDDNSGYHDTEEVRDSDERIRHPYYHESLQYKYNPFLSSWAFNVYKKYMNFYKSKRNKLRGKKRPSGYGHHKYESYETPVKYGSHDSSHQVYNKYPSTYEDSLESPMKYEQSQDSSEYSYQSTEKIDEGPMSYQQFQHHLAKYNHHQSKDQPVRYTSSHETAQPFYGQEPSTEEGSSTSSYSDVTESEEKLLNQWLDFYSQQIMGLNDQDGGNLNSHFQTHFQAPDHEEPDQERNGSQEESSYTNYRKRSSSSS